MSSTLPNPDGMRLSEIQSELKERGVSYEDCFDRESLTKRLLDARDGKTVVNSREERSEERCTPVTEGEKPSSTTRAADDSPKPSAASSLDFDREAVLTDLRSLRVNELRSRLGSRNIRWAGMLEKEDLVKALADAMELSSNFSLSGSLTPGEVGDISGDILAEELGGAAGVPLLLDVYATWCGPCQLMVPQLAAAAEELGDMVRVAKLDSDKYPEWATKLRAGGLPTVIVFSPDGKEVERIEGALMKDGLLDLVRRNL